MTAVAQAVPQIDIRTAFVNINRAFVGARESGVNDGTFVKWLDELTKQDPPAPWCASMQAKAGYALLHDHWPVPLSASCQAIADWATRHQCLIAEPTVGALMLFWHQNDKRGPRYAHIGCVIEVKPDGSVVTVEGNTSEGPGLSREGIGCFQKIRKPEPKDAFCYWWIAL